MIVAESTVSARSRRVTTPSHHVAAAPRVLPQRHGDSEMRPESQPDITKTIPPIAQFGTLSRNSERVCVPVLCRVVVVEDRKVPGLATAPHLEAVQAGL